MRIVKYLIFFLIFIIFEFVMFNVSFELGVSSLILITTILCIWIVLKKITTVVIGQEITINSNIKDNKKFDSNNTISGIDGSIFEKFKRQLNLKSITNLNSEPKSSNQNLEKEDIFNMDDENPDKKTKKNVFAEELDDKEQIRVTLSKNAKNLKEFQEDISIKEVNSKPELDDLSQNKTKPAKKTIGAGEEALKILSSKQKALREQTESSPISDLIDYEDDIFEDELIPIPGGEDYYNKEKDNSKDKKKHLHSQDSNFLEDEEYLENSITNNQTENEKQLEAEALLNLATSSCEAGKIEEAKVSLKIYLDLLKDLNQEPNIDVKKLLKKLELSTNIFDHKEKIRSNELLKPENISNQENILQELPEQSNYANVMDGLVKSLEDKEAYGEALPLLIDLIEYNRKRGNISEMDNLFDRIEQAYSSLKNDENLVSAYKEHLIIKQQLKDLEGELNLLDLISYYYANTGNQDASKRYQAESKRVKTLIEEKINSEKNL